MKTYTSLKNAGLPIPPDLQSEVESATQPGPAAGGGAGGLPAMPSGGGGPGGPGPGGGPGEQIVMPPPPGDLAPGGPMGPGGPNGPTVPGGGPPPAGGIPGGPPGAAPPVSMERRPGAGMGMPRPSKVASEEEDGIDSTNSDETDTVEIDGEEAVLRKLPQAKEASSEKKYSIIDPDVEPLDESEAESESS
jgi:hypothetical protein